MEEREPDLAVRELLDVAPVARPIQSLATSLAQNIICKTQALNVYHLFIFKLFYYYTIAVMNT